MRWRRTGNAGIEDRRGMGGPATIGGVGGGLGLILLLVNMFLGGGGGFDVEGLEGLQPAQPADRGDAPDPDKDLVDFMGFVVDDTQTMWRDTFQGSRRTWKETTLVLFEGSTQTGCGLGSEATGPFYCPADEKMYLDLGFFRELQRRFGAPGDFAQAYVIAHEMGHHVQNVLGVNQRVTQLQERNRRDANELSIRMELQADCLAGVWGNSAARRELLEPGDLEEGIGAAAAVGDDRIQEQATGRISPESWTHGSAAQRTTWFRRGFDGGSIEDCDSFSGKI